jgi:hypothetical protein
MHTLFREHLQRGFSYNCILCRPHRFDRIANTVLSVLYSQLKRPNNFKIPFIKKYLEIE